MQKTLFQILLIAAIISTSVGQAYAQQGVYCAQNVGCCVEGGTCPAGWTCLSQSNGDCMAWAEGQIQPCGNSQCAVATANPNCPSGYLCTCYYGPNCPNPSSSPDKHDMKDKRVERHKEVANETSDAKGNVSE